MRLKSLFCAVFCLICLLALAAPSLLAQSGATGAIEGTVTDPTGATVPNVTVTATSAATAQVRTVTTGGDGSYKFNLLNPGQYSVKFEAVGFQTVEVPSVTVTISEIGTLNRQLQVGAQSQQVTVEANVETVQTASSTVGTVVNSKAIVDIPLSTRNYTNLIGLSAGANGAVQNATAIGKGSGNVSVNGSNLSQNTWQMDGAFITNFDGRNDLRESGTFGSIAIPNPDALQEFKIQTSTFDASYGRNPGANVNVVTRSGSNAFHGAAFEFFRNTVLNANDWFLNRTGSPRGVLNQNQYGGVFGGPVKKDKLFFFVSYQETNQKNGYAITSLQSAVLPPIPLGSRGATSCALSNTTIAQCEAADGSGATTAFVSALGNNICPGNAAFTSGAQINSQSVANSQAQVTPTSFYTNAHGGNPLLNGAQVACNGLNINPVALRILQLKLPNGSYYIPSSLSLPASAFVGLVQGYGNASYSIPSIYKEHQGLGNWDYVINSKHTLAGRYFYSADPTLSAFQTNLGGNVGSNFIPGPNANLKYANMNAVLKLTSVLSNNLVNEARLSYQRNATTVTPQQLFTSSQVGMQPTQAGIDTLPYAKIAGLFQYGTTSSALVFTRVNQYQVADTVSWTRGKHSLRMGFERDNEFYYYNLQGFPIGQTFINSFADLLLGLPGCFPGTPTLTCQTSGQNSTTTGTANSFFQSITVTGRTPPPGNVHDTLGTAYDGFIQDDFKVSQRLTLNLGLRWEYDAANSSIDGRASSVWPSLVNIQPFPGTGCNYNGTAYGVNVTAPNTGTGCSFAGFELPANYSLARIGIPVPAGVYIHNTNATFRNSPPWDNFAPRVGFAWQPLPTNRFVVRGGGGYFYDRPVAGLLGGTISQSVPTLIAFAGNGSNLYASSLQHPYPDTPLGFIPRWTDFASGGSSNINVNGGSPIAQSFLTPLVYEWNLNVQYEVAPSWVLEVGYVGSHGIHQLQAYPINGAPLANLANPVNCGYDGNPAHCVTTSTVANGISSGQGGANIRVPYLGFQAATGQTGTTGSFKFNSAQATLRKQFSHGLTMQAAYAWSRGTRLVYTGNPNESFTNNVPVIAIYGPNPEYRPHRLTVNYAYDLPFGHHEGLVGKLVGGWTWSGVTTIQDGDPLTITDSRGGSIFGSPVTGNAQYAVGKGPADVGTPGGVSSRVNGYFNPAAFITTANAGTVSGCVGATSTCGTLFGNSGLGIILGPGQNNWDMSLSKLTKVGGLREDATLTFRAEFFNTFNHPQFIDPIVAVQSSDFGKSTQASVNQRLIQFALKYSF